MVYHNKLLFNKSDLNIEWLRKKFQWVCFLFVIVIGFTCSKDNTSNLHQSPVLFSPQGTIVGITTTRELREWDFKKNQFEVLQNSIPEYEKTFVLPDQQHILILGKTELLIVSSQKKEAIFSMPIANLSGQKGVAFVLLAPGRFLLLTEDGVIQEWNQGIFVNQVSLEAKSDWLPIEQAQFSQDGLRLVTRQAQSNVARVWDGKTGKLINHLVNQNGPFHPIYQVALSANGMVAITVDEMGKAMRWNIAPSTSLDSIQIGVFDAMPMTSIVLSKDASMIAMGGENGTIIVWKEFPPANAYVYNPHPMYGLWRRFLGHQNAIRSLAFSSLENYLASSSQDQTIKIWNTEQDQATPVFPNIKTAKFSADGQFLFTIPPEGDIHIYSVKSLQSTAFQPEKVAILSNENSITSYNQINISPKQTKYVIAHNGKRADLWDVSNLNTPQRVSWIQFSMQNSPFSKILFSKDERFVFGWWLDRVSASTTCTSLGAWDITNIPVDKETSPLLFSVIRCLAVGESRDFITDLSLSKDGSHLFSLVTRSYADGSTTSSMSISNFSIENGLVPVGSIEAPSATTLNEKFGSFPIPFANKFRFAYGARSLDEVAILSDANVLQVWDIDPISEPQLKMAVDYSQSTQSMVGVSLQMDEQGKNILLADEQNHFFLLDPNSYQIKLSFIHPVFIEKTTRNSYRLVGAELSAQGDQGLLLLRPYSAPMNAAAVGTLWKIPSILEVANIDLK